MFTKKLLKTLCIIAIAMLGATFAHGASGDQPSSVVATTQHLSDPFEIVGFSCSNHGNHSLITSEVTADSTECSLTLVYSEHPTLKSQELLNEIACNLAQKPIDYNNHESFKSLCKTETSKYIQQTLAGRQDDSCTCISERTPSNLIALCIQLSLERMKYVSYYLDNTYEGYGVSGSLDMSYPMGNGKKMQSATATSHLPIQSHKAIESAQEEAEQLQEQNPNERFHLVLDLKKWKQIVAEKRAEAKEARRIQRESTPPAPLPGCAQQ